MNRFNRHIALGLFWGILIFSGTLSAQNFQGQALNTEVNSPYEELNPMLSGDGKTLYFVRSGHPKNEGGKAAGQDIWMSKMDSKGNWGKAERLPDPLNNLEHNAVGGVAQGNDALILTNLYPSDGGYAPGISVANGFGMDWGDPQKIMDASQTAREGYFTLYCRPQMDLMIVSMTKGNSDAEDLFVSRRDESGHWLTLKDLGKQINSPGFETSPFLSKDTRLLFFSSDYYAGEGNADVFMSFRRDESWTNWSTPVNLGREVNRSGFDGYFVIDPKQKYAYLISGEKDEDPGDIYSVPMAKIPLLRPLPMDTLQEITRQGTPLVLNFGPDKDKINYDKSFGYSITQNGQFFMNSRQNEPFVYTPNPEFSGEDTLYSVICRGNECTSYAILVKVVPGIAPPLPRTMDTVRVSTLVNTPVAVRLPNEDPSQKEYRSIEKRSLTVNGELKISPTGEPFKFFPLTDFTGEEITEITLCDAAGCRIYPVKIQVNEDPQAFIYGDSPPVLDEEAEDGMVWVSGHVLDQVTRDQLNANLSFYDLSTGETVETTVEKNSPFRIELQAGRSYQVSVNHNDYLSLNTTIDPSSRALGGKAEYNFELKKSPISVNPNDIFALSNVYFDTDKATLQERSFAPLDSIAEFLGKNPEIKAEFRGHTDSQGDDAYNQKLSQARAETVVKYMIKKGIDERRLSFRGFGEEKPVADNFTEKGRALNRRVELRVIR
ncbi:MAG: OmpA family protein [Bacteroidia bacterium]|nr:OmpA family protein [Bacteroidia bacterium]